VTTPTWGSICQFNGQCVVHRLGLAMINVHSKFAVSKFTHYEDMKGNAKCRNWGGLGLRVTSNVTIIQSTQVCLLPFSSYSYSYSFLSKVSDFNLPTCILHPIRVTPFEIRLNLCLQKMEVPELSCGVACVIPSLAVLIQYRRVTDRRTDGHTTATNTT